MPPWLDTGPPPAAVPPPRREVKLKRFDHHAMDDPAAGGLVQYPVCIGRGRGRDVDLRAAEQSSMRSRQLFNNILHTVGLAQNLQVTNQSITTHYLPV